MIRPVDNSLWYSKSGVSKRAADGTFIPQKRLYQPPTLFGAAAAVVLTSNQDYWFANKLIDSSDEVFTITYLNLDCSHWNPNRCPCIPQIRQTCCPAKVVRRSRNSLDFYNRNVRVHPESLFFYVPK